MRHGIVWPVRWRAAVLVVLCMAMFAGLARAEVVLTDERGTVHRWAAPPQRIVSLLPSLTETVCALGACERLVGVDRYSNWPASIARLPRVGGGIDPAVESIVALKPDAVLIAASSRAVEPLRALGLRVVVLEPMNTADVRRVLRTVAQLLGQPGGAADAVWTRIDAAVSEQARALPPALRGLRYYFEVNAAPFGAGEASFIGELLARLGLRNILPAAMGPFPQVNPEYVVRADPDVILIGDQAFGGLAQRPGWSAMRAVRDRRVCIFSQPDSDVLVRPGPRLDEAAAIVTRCLREVHR